MKQNTMPLEEWAKIFRDYPVGRLEEGLTETLKRIKLLESIYQSTGENYWYSDWFNDCAYKERQDLCQVSSAYFMVLREKGVDTDKFYQLKK